MHINSNSSQAVCRMAGNLLLLLLSTQPALAHLKNGELVN